MAFELPPLPYDYSALEPTIDAATMKLHHDMHHAAYVKNLNAALEKHPNLQSKSAEDLIRDLSALPEDIRGAVRNNGGGHVNHSMFWKIMKPKGGGDPSGPIADAILYHHEHIDGHGYPAGLIGNEIPLASRIVAVCSTFDTLTARETYRSPMTHQDAISELRRVAGRQLDADLVNSFISMVERENDAFDPNRADFEAELSFEQRARTLAQPAPGDRP